MENLEQQIAQIMTKRVISDGIGFLPAAQYIPHKPTARQQLFLDLNDKLEVFYGGAAGGGKSDALLMAALEYIHVPGYAALLMRKTYADLSRPGALMDRAADWLQGKAHWSADTKTWTFPSGATLTFGYLDTEAHKYQYQSAEFQYIGFDELTHFEESQYRYLFSRLRRKKEIPVPLRMRSGSNPGGIGGRWVKDRFIPEDFTAEDAIPEQVWSKDGVDEETGETITRYFVPARLDDNPHIDQTEYDRSLKELDAVERAQLRRGDWSITVKGDILYMWAESQVIVPWSRFREAIGSSHIPPHWQIGVFQDWGTTPQHPCMTLWFATAAENAPVVNGVPLAGSVFLYRSLHEVKQTARQIKKKIYDAMVPYNEIHRTRMWEMSHEASSERLEYLVNDTETPYSLPFSNWETGKTRGIEQLKHAITPKQLDKPHPFNPGVKGHPLLYILVDDDEYTNPKTEAGMLRLRLEAPAYRWNVPKSGETARKLEPFPLFNDAIDALRGAAAKYWPSMEETSVQEILDRKLQASVPFDIHSESLSEGSQIAMSIQRNRAIKQMAADYDMEEYGLTNQKEDEFLSDISEGW